MTADPSLVVVGRPGDPRVRALAAVADRSGRPYVVHAPDSAAGAAVLAGVDPVALAAAADGDPQPVVVVTGSVVLLDPIELDLVEALGFPRAPAHTECEIAIVGAGPAGLAAAIGVASAGRRTVVVDPQLPGGSLDRSARVGDYLGFPEGITAAELIDRAVAQARAAGVGFLLTERVEEILDHGDGRLLVLTSGATVRARAVVLATGRRPRPSVELSLPGVLAAEHPVSTTADPAVAVAVGAGAAAARRALDYLAAAGSTD